ncbi:hypothetical protein HZC32_00810, partial [Candidatus Woesearchaeota archaeon]|nr:hypothetical protein [Candidatus Woesearchaeota archaeon]
MNEDLNSVDGFIRTIMNNADKITLGVGLISLPFLASFFLGNYTGTSIGLVILGSAIT